MCIGHLPANLTQSSLLTRCCAAETVKLPLTLTAGPRSRPLTRLDVRCTLSRSLTPLHPSYLPTSLQINSFIPSSCSHSNSSWIAPWKHSCYMRYSASQARLDTFQTDSTQSTAWVILGCNQIDTYRGHCQSYSRRTPAKAISI